MELNYREGEAIVKYARQVIESSYSKEKVEVPSALEKLFKEDRGAFVTLHTSNHGLRGCIGFPEPVLALGKAVEQAAVSAAFRDPRFPMVEENELKNLIIEVSVLSKPVLIEAKNPEEYVEKIEVGVHGLIAEKGGFRGLLLPQVPIEQNWDATEFLRETCMKAGLRPDSYTNPEFKLYGFTAQVFSEELPDGKVEERKLTK